MHENRDHIVMVGKFVVDVLAATAVQTFSNIAQGSFFKRCANVYFKKDQLSACLQLSACKDTKKFIES